ncbi:MAG: polysaccharide biosynthesis/export family protein [Paraglaciecola sp.]|uniref:polysaccharide biosynthesis/export family protein n=1 Tax=Paraglaciecola sp. TaxID=1920173 RepID=UPI00329918ED
MYRILTSILILFVSCIANSQETPIQPGDLLRISVYGNPDLTTETEVSSNGFVSLPLVGTVKISELSSNDASTQIEAKLRAKKVLKTPQVVVVVLESKSNTISILGQVNAPGKYKINAGARSLIDFISIAGGLTQNASKKLVVIKPKEKSTQSKITINLYQTLEQGDVSILNNSIFLLDAGDIIFVPEAPVFFIYGEVNRPGSFILKDNMTVAQALALGGGISIRGTARGITIKRQDEEGNVQDIKVNENTLLQANDTLYINESIF